MIAQSSTAELLQRWQFLAPPDRRILQKEWRRVQKHRAGIHQEWQDGVGELTGWVCMFRDVGRRPSVSHVLCRHDNKKPFGPGNAFWSVKGRPPAKIMVAGQEIKLVDAALLADYDEAGFLARTKKLGIESAIMTPKYCTKHYPQQAAIDFLSKIDLLSCAALFQVEEERSQWAAANPKKKEKFKSQREMDYTLLVHSKAANQIGMVLHLPIPSCDKIRLLAYYSMPSRVKKHTYNVLKSIIARCTSPKHKHYCRYGGRGIQVCDRWIRGSGELNGLQCFIADMGAWQPGMEMDRIDPDGNYEIGNCRWATREVNVRNTFPWESVSGRIEALKIAQLNTRVSSELAKSRLAMPRRNSASVIKAAIARCTNPLNKNYADYGGRGIAVCDRWLNGTAEHSGVECFIMDMGPQIEGMELDRIDNDGNYEPANCRWVDHKINTQNAWRWMDLYARLDAMVVARARAMFIQWERERAIRRSRNRLERSDSTSGPRVV